MKLRKSPEEQAEDEARRAEEKARRDAEREEARFNASPAGRARAAREGGQRFFQLTVPIENVDRTWIAKFSHEMDTRVRDTGNAVGMILTAVEAEGWELIEAGYVFRQTANQSRDKFWASGQQIAVIGSTLGVYLFRRRDTP